MKTKLKCNCLDRRLGLEKEAGKGERENELLQR